MAYPRSDNGVAGARSSIDSVLAGVGFFSVRRAERVSEPSRSLAHECVILLAAV